MDLRKHPFRRHAIEPVECLRGGWRLIEKDYWFFLAITVVGILVGSLVPLGLLMGPFICGIYLCLLRQQQGEPVAFDTLFQGFKFFSQSLIAMLLMMAPLFLLMIPMSALFISAFFFALPVQTPGKQPDPTAMLPILGIYALWMLATILCSWIVAVMYCFTYPLIVDRNLSGLEAVKMSFRAALANLGGLLGLTILNGLIGMAGMLLCCVGTYLTLPLTFAATWVAYQQVFAADDNEQDYVEPGGGRS
jgi:uncharacterized membrane protein